SNCQVYFPFCTTPTAINSGGVTTGFYADDVGGIHGFVRAKNGTITKFDGPNAKCFSPLGGNMVCTEPNGINPQGRVWGYYCDEVTCHGFVRTKDGTITPFDPPGSVYTFDGLNGHGGQTGGINPSGAIVGTYFTNTGGNFGVHGFVRAPDGTFASF